MKKVILLAHIHWSIIFNLNCLNFTNFDFSYFSILVFCPFSSINFRFLTIYFIWIFFIFLSGFSFITDLLSMLLSVNQSFLLTRWLLYKILYRMLLFFLLLLSIELFQIGSQIFTHIWTTLTCFTHHLMFSFLFYLFIQ